MAVRVALQDNNTVLAEGGRRRQRGSGASQTKVASRLHLHLAISVLSPVNRLLIFDLRLLSFELGLTREALLSLDLTTFTWEKG